MVNRVTGKLNLNLGHKSFVLHGNLVNDKFIHDDLTITNIENVLQRFLFDKGFEEIAFYHTQERLNIVTQSQGSAATTSGGVQTENSPLQGRRRMSLRTKVDSSGRPPLDNPIVIPDENQQAPNIAASDFSKVSWANALDYMNSMMKNPLKTAIIFRDVHNMLLNGDLNPKFTSLFNSWMKLPNGNVVFFVSTTNQINDVSLPPEIMNYIIDERKQPLSELVIKIGGCDREELNRLIKRKILFDNISVDTRILENALDALARLSIAQELRFSHWASSEFVGSIQSFNKETLKLWKSKHKEAFKALGDKTIEKLDSNPNILDTAELKNELKVVRDQDDNINAIISTLDDWFLGKKEKPLTYLLCGTSGTGKTFTVERIADCLNSYGYTYFYQTMNDFTSEESINRLIGSPTGYVGSETEPKLFSELRKSDEKMVICFDEIDKAHEKIRDSLMQLFEKGTLSWNNVTGDFSKCIIFLTSNAGMAKLVKLKSNFVKDGEFKETKDFIDGFDRILSEVKFPSYIVGRMNRKLIYNSLSDSAIIDIAIKQTQSFFSEKKDGFTVSIIDPEYLLEILRNSSGSTLGARVIKERISSILNEDEKASKFIKQNEPPVNFALKYTDHSLEIMTDQSNSIQDRDILKREVLDKYKKEKNKLGSINKSRFENILSVIRCQDDNIQQIIISVRSWFQKPAKPLIFFLAGTSGTGKSFTAEKLAEAMREYGYKYSFFPMNEYADEQRAYEIFGLPPGITGDRDKPKLFNDLESTNGKLIVCFDEVEKAYSGFYQRIMSLMQNGIIEWSNEQWDFRKCIIVMTSNIAMEQFVNLKKRYHGKIREADDVEKFKDETAKILNDNGIPSYITGRIDKTLIYNFLDAESVYDIAFQEIQKFGEAKNLKIRYISPKILAEIIHKSVNSNEGARKVINAVKSLLEEKLTDFVERYPDITEITIE